MDINVATELRPPKINEALELALAAIDKESSPHPTQIEESFPQPPIVPSNNQITFNTTSTSVINNKTTLIANTSVIQENRVMTQEQQQKQQQKHTETITLINNTDEEKCRKLQNQEQSNMAIMQEKSEEEISKEPIYENVVVTATTQKFQSSEVSTTISASSNISAPSAYQEQQPQIIPSMISNPRQQPNDELLQHNQNLNQNDNFNQNASNQLQQPQQQQQLSQINSCLTTKSKSATTTCSIINNNNNNNNNSNSNLNTNNDNLVGLTTAFANQTLTETITAAATVTATALTADNTSDNINVSVTTNNNNKNNNNSSSNNNHIFSRDTTPNVNNMFSDSATTVTIEQNPVKTQTTSTVINSNNINENLMATTTPSSSSPADSMEPYYQVPKSSEPYYDAPKHLRPVPVYENIEIFFNGSVNGELSAEPSLQLQPPKEKPPPPPMDSPPLFDDDDVDSPMDTNYSSSDNTYETLSRHQQSSLHHYQSQQLQQQQHHHHHHAMQQDHPSPPMKRMNSTKRIKKEIRNKRSSFLGIEGSSLEDDDSYLELTVAPPPDMAQLLQEERRLEKQLYLKAGLCDSSDTGESRDSGVSENHSRQSSEHYTNSSEENDQHDDTTSPLTLQTQTALDSSPSDMLYQNDGLLAVAPTPLLQTVKGNSAESWTESATVAAAATQSLTEATATANAKMMSIEEKIREQEEVLRVERELLQLEQEELKRQRENLMLRESMARRELQHGAKMLMSANRRSLQDLNGLGAMTVMTGGGSLDINGAMIPTNNMDLYHMNQLNGYVSGQNYPAKTQTSQQQQQHQQSQQHHHQQIYANIPNLQQQYYQMDTDYRKSMSDINEFSKHMLQPPVPPSKPMRAMQMSTANRLINGTELSESTSEFSTRQRHSLNSQNFGGSLVKIANAPPTAAPRGGAPHIYSNYHHQSAQNLNVVSGANLNNNNHSAANQNASSLYPGNMSRNTLHALSATPKPKYTDGWVQVQQRKSYDTNFANDPAWVSAHQQKRKSMPDSTYQQYGGNNHWLVQEAEQRRLAEQQQRRVQSSATTSAHQSGKLAAVQVGNGNVSNGKPLPDSIIQTLTERVQSKGIGERKRNNLDKSPLHAASQYHQYSKQQQQQHQTPNSNQTNHHQTLISQQQSSVNRHQQHTTTTIPMTTSVSANGQVISATTTTSSNSMSMSMSATNLITSQQDKVLSVSGKKKCSHCGDELGRGAAMIIESLLLFYHINCFKCCVCHVQLGDGLNGTDVRVRNHKLHCQNCYSSDDGIKFSCV